MFETNPHDKIPQLEAMRHGVDYRQRVSIRGFEIYVRPLSIMETNQVAATVQEKLSMLPESARHRLTEHTLLAKETLINASTSDVGANDARITDHILDRMTNAEIHYLYKQYVAAMDRVDPSLEQMSPEDLRALVDELKKNPKADLGSVLIELSFSQLVSLAHYFLTKSD